MFKGNTGLLALCALLAAAAFAVVFVAPRYMDGGEAPPPEVVAEAGDAPGPQEAVPNAGDAVTAEAEPVEEVAEPEASAEETAAPTDDAPEAVPGTAQETAAAPAEAEKQEVVPAFDVLRVEPDGSMVIAGRAAPGSMVEIVNGEDVLASTEAGPAGDFAAVLDDPLAPGDYQIALRAKGKDGASTRSDEVATVSVPRGEEEELLALVTRPGQASRIVTAPEADAPDADGPEDTAGGAGEGDAAPETATAKAADESSLPQPDPAGGTEEPVADTEGRNPSASSEEDAAGKASESGGGEVAALGSADTRDETATDPGAAKGNRPAVGAVENVRIDAVEVENDHLFVTGSAEPGSVVGVYVDNVLAGSDEVGEEGRFLVEERMPLTVGEHQIRADMTVDGEVVARALVPFTRPAGDAAAAVARSAPIESGDAMKAPPTDARSAQESAAPAESETEMTADGAGPTGTAAAEDGASSPAVQPGTAEVAARDEAEEPASSSPAATGEGGDEAVATLRQQPLEPTDASVIIRRGDTLWEISRRVYGQGVRYTTIYLANDEQIANPDLILPGQIFTVPDESLENSEELHRRRMLGLDG